MSIRTTLEEIRVNTPNVFTGTEHAVIVFFAYLALFVPKYGQIAHNLLMEVGEQITLDSQEREAQQRENIVKFKERDRIEALSTAEKQKEIDAKDKEIAVTDAQREADHIISEVETAAAIDVLHERAKGKTTEIKADREQTVQRTQQDTKHRLIEQETSHQIKLFNQLREHLDKMTALHIESTHSTDALNAATERNTVASQASQKSIVTLNRATEKNRETTHHLLEALHQFDSIIRAGDLNTDREKALHTVLMAAMEADIKLETTIATTHVQQQAELQLALKADLADKNRHLADVLADCASETLAKLTTLIESDIRTTQQALMTLETGDAKTECQTRLDKLVAMQQTVQIQIEKTNLAHTTITPSAL